MHLSDNRSAVDIDYLRQYMKGNVIGIEKESNSLHSSCALIVVWIINEKSSRNEEAKYITVNKYHSVSSLVTNILFPVRRSIVVMLNSIIYIVI